MHQIAQNGIKSEKVADFRYLIFLFAFFVINVYT